MGISTYFASLILTSSGKSGCFCHPTVTPDGSLSNVGQCVEDLLERSHDNPESLEDDHGTA